MPHLTIEYTADIAAVAGFDSRAVLDAAMGALQSLGEFDMPSAKGRARRLDEFAVDHPHDGTGYVAVQLRILPGRSAELRARTSQALAEAIAQALPSGARGTVAVEVVEMERESYSKVALS